MALVISTWLWGHKYSPEDVAKLRAGISRHLKEPHRFICFTDQDFRIADVETAPIVDIELTKVQGCFARLRMFDPMWQRRWIWRRMDGRDDRLVNMDLDTVITGDLDRIFKRDENFLILHGANSTNPCKFCGALMMLRPGALPKVWSDFSLEAVATIPCHEFPDDQGWIWHKYPEASGWKCGHESGVYAFKKPGWPREDYLPRDAAMVTFNGWRSPSAFAATVPWIKQHWRI